MEELSGEGVCMFLNSAPRWRLVSPNSGGVAPSIQAEEDGFPFSGGGGMVEAIGTRPSVVARLSRLPCSLLLIFVLLGDGCLV